jgi:hypothetical protein
VGGECSQIGPITTEDGAARFGHGHDDGVDRGSLSRLGPQGGGSASERLRDGFSDVAGLEEPIG